MTGPVEEYLSQLRASLRTRPAQTSQILAEAEDHLRSSVAAGLRAGMTEIAAQEAAVSAFGSVRAVARAHQTRRARAAVVLGGWVMTSSKLAGLSLLAFGVTNLVLFALVELTHPGVRPAPGISALSFAGPVPRGLAAGAAGLLLLAGCFTVRRFGRRRLAAAPGAGKFPLVAAVFFGICTVVQILLIISGSGTGALPVLATLALAIGYGIRARRPARAARKNGRSVPA
jgi:hypothetical protein